MDIATVAVLGAFAVVIANIWARNRMRELKFRERMAMIDKGLVPPPEADPAGFDRAMGAIDKDVSRGTRAPRKHLRLGILMLGVGVGTFILTGAASGSFREGLGIGGFFLALALAFLLIALLERPRNPRNDSSLGEGSPPSKP